MVVRIPSRDRMRISRLSPILVLVALPAFPQPSWRAPGSKPPQAAMEAQAPSAEDVRARTKTLLAGQHRDDETLEIYERIERHIDRTGGANPRTIADKTYRVVPTGVGTQEILLHEEGKSTDSSAYARQMRTLEDTLETMANPDDPRAKAAYAKYQKRMRERAQFVDAASEAYIPQWAGREKRNERDCDVFELNPNPKFQPRSMFQDALAHTTAKLWIDHASQQIVHGEARVMSDISFGAGILGKLYRGSVVSMDQAEIAPGVWLPIRYQYDYAGRKFLFTFDQHQVIEVSHYRRIGPPKEALQVVQNELSNGKSFTGDP